MFLIFLTFLILQKKSFKFSKYKNIQESGSCSHLILVLNNNNKWIYEKQNICYAKYCYKMKIFSILGWCGGLGQKWPMKQLSTMHKQTILKHIIQPINFIRINV